MAGEDDDDDSMAHAADEPTAMWGADELAGLDLHRAPSEPPKGPAQPSSSRGEASVKVTLDRSVPPARKKPTRRRSQAVQWVVTILGAIVLAVVAFFVVRALR